MGVTGDLELDSSFQRPLQSSLLIQEKGFWLVD